MTRWDPLAGSEPVPVAPPRPWTVVEVALVGFGFGLLLGFIAGLLLPGWAA